MASRGFLIRFIDIGLIVLFGFLMISDIEALSHVDLAGAQQEVEALEDASEDRAFVLVEVTPDGRFAVSDPAAPEAGYAVASNTDALAQELGERKTANLDAGFQTVILIEPDPASAVQFTVDVMDVCDRLAIVKSLRMDIEIEAAPEQRQGAL